MIEWAGEDRIVVDGRPFDVINVASAKDSPPAGAIRKPRWYIDRYIELAQELEPRRAVELGIDSGGSTVFFALLMPSLDRLLAIDIDDVPPGLAEFVDCDPRGDRVRSVGGVDQADSARLRSLLDETFGTDPLDLVIDDASHLLPQTRASFDVLFPRLAPGGVFVVEDWTSEHQRGRVIADRMRSGDLPPPTDLDAPLARPMPMSRLILESAMVAANAPEVVTDVRLHLGWAEIVRGPAELSATDFRLADHLGWLAERVLEQSLDEH